MNVRQENRSVKTAFRAAGIFALLERLVGARATCAALIIPFADFASWLCRLRLVVAHHTRFWFFVCFWLKVGLADAFVKGANDHLLVVLIDTEKERMPFIHVNIEHVIKWLRRWLTVDHQKVTVLRQMLDRFAQGCHANDIITCSGHLDPFLPGIASKLLFPRVQGIANMLFRRIVMESRPRATVGEDHQCVTHALVGQFRKPRGGLIVLHDDSDGVAIDGHILPSMNFDIGEDFFRLERERVDERLFAVVIHLERICRQDEAWLEDGIAILICGNGDVGDVHFAVV